MIPCLYTARGMDSKYNWQIKGSLRLLCCKWVKRMISIKDFPPARKNPCPSQKSIRATFPMKPSRTHFSHAFTNWVIFYISLEHNVAETLTNNFLHQRKLLKKTIEPLQIWIKPRWLISQWDQIYRRKVGQILTFLPESCVCFCIQFKLYRSRRFDVSLS